MKRANRVRKQVRLNAAIALVLALMMVLSSWSAMTASAAEQGRVNATKLNVRKDASATSDKVGSLVNGDVITINSEKTGADGYVWYQITVNGVTGYVRSDYIQKTSTGGTATGVNPTVEVTKVQPAGASIKGGDNVRVRPDASTSGNFITTVSGGTAITITGQATGTDGYVWYLVNFTANGSTVEGFVRSDFVNLSGELVPVDSTGADTNPDEDTQPDTTTPEVEPEPETKDWDTVQKDDDKWYLIDYVNGREYDISKYGESYQNNGEELIDARKSVKTQKVFIIILVVLLIGAVLLAAMLFFKVRDISDEAYFLAVEKETIKERNAMKGQQGKTAPPSGRKVMQTVGTDGTRSVKPVEPRLAPRPGVQNPANKAVANGQTKQAVPPTQGRPVQPAGQRPVQPVQGRPAQTAPQSRPVQGTAAPGAVGSRPAGTVPAQNTGKPAAARPASAPAQSQTQAVRPAPKPQKPVIDDDDEFEFEFLNWDGEEK